MKNKFRMLYMDVHVLQMLPPSNVNRGEGGEPKMAIIGGVTRSRLSSQAQKRAMRVYFGAHGVETAIRTRETSSEITRRLMEKGIEKEEAEKLSKMGAEDAKLGTDVLTFISDAQYDAISEVLINKNNKVYEKDSDYKKELKDAVIKNPSIDELLFGRMFATDQSLNYDAASQVMHAFSVNRVKTEFDFFTAVDDIAENSGAGHMSSKMFTDPVFYRYANLNLSETSELIRYGKEHAVEASGCFVEAFVKAMPTGAIHAFANTTLPSDVIITLRDDQPVNFAPAFLTPVKEEDYLEEAKKKLEKEMERVSDNFGAPIFTVRLGEKPFTEMISDLEAEISRRI